MPDVLVTSNTLLNSLSILCCHMQVIRAQNRLIGSVIAYHRFLLILQVGSMDIGLDTNYIRGASNLSQTYRCIGRGATKCHQRQDVFLCCRGRGNICPRAVNKSQVRGGVHLVCLCTDRTNSKKWLQHAVLTSQKAANCCMCGASAPAHDASAIPSACAVCSVCSGSNWQPHRYQVDAQRTTAVTQFKDVARRDVNPVHD